MTQFYGTAANIHDLTAVTEGAARQRSLHRMRPASQVDAAVLHQTGYHRPSVPMMYKDTVAHFVVMPNGVIVQLHPELRFLNASSQLNDRGIAIEFVGNFPNENMTWWSGDPSRNRPTPEQIQGGRDLLRHLANSLGITNVFAHRQGFRIDGRHGDARAVHHHASDNGRSNCPGPDIWYHVGEWAMTSLLFSDGGPDFALADGDPIPDRWRQPLA